jgi:hypothetical protein
MSVPGLSRRSDRPPVTSGSTPINRHLPSRLACLKRATSGRIRCSKRGIDQYQPIEKRRILPKGLIRTMCSNARLFRGEAQRKPNHRSRACRPRRRFYLLRCIRLKLQSEHALPSFQLSVAVGPVVGQSQPCSDHCVTLVGKSDLRPLRRLMCLRMPS